MKKQRRESVMKNQEADYLLGRLNGQYNSLKEGLRRIEDCLKPLKEKVSKNETSIVKIKAIGATISGLFILALTGIRIWLGMKE